jgi:hypothetical protein
MWRGANFVRATRGGHHDLSKHDLGTVLSLLRFLSFGDRCRIYNGINYFFMTNVRMFSSFCDKNVLLELERNFPSQVLVHFMTKTVNATIVRIVRYL